MDRREKNRMEQERRTRMEHRGREGGRERRDGQGVAEERQSEREKREGVHVGREGVQYLHAEGRDGVEYRYTGIGNARQVWKIRQGEAKDR